MRKRAPKAPEIIFTIGHSTRSREELIGLLREYGITRLVDVRTVPRSRHNPQFNREEMSTALPAGGIMYVHMPGLGGLRKKAPDSINLAWDNAGFRGYADYMQTAEFETNLQALIEQAGRGKTAVMCAEAVPWRCHRSLIADALLVRNIAVEHILSAGSHRLHSLNPWAKVEGSRITYPAPKPRAA